MEFTEKMTKAKTALLATQRHPWEQATAMYALYEAGETEDMLALAAFAVYLQTPDGRPAIMATEDVNNCTDPCACGIPLNKAFELTGDERFATARDKLLKYALEDAPRSKDGIVYHLISRAEYWVDSVFMLPPFLAEMGKYHEALHQINGYWDKLYLPGKKLMAHRWDEKNARFLTGVAWATGNGWSMVGMSKVAELLPGGMESERNMLRGRTLGLIEAAIPYMREDGLFHDILDDPDSYVDCCSSMMFAYAIFKGIADGWLDKKYMAAAEKARNAADSCVDRYGFITPVSGAYEFNRPGLSSEAQSFYILMEAARQQASACTLDA